MGQVRIAIPLETVKALREARSILYVLKAVGSSNAAGRPLVWHRRSDYGQNTVVRWEPPFNVYIAPPVVGTGPVLPGDSTNIAPGQVWRLTDKGNEVFEGGPPSDLSIENHTKTVYSSGMSQAVDSSAARPLCVFPLGAFMHLEPLDRVVMFFSTNDLPLGTVFEHPWPAAKTRGLAMTIFFAAGSVSFAIDVNVAGAPGDTRNVQYEEPGGWTWGGGTWASTLPPTGDFVSALIVKPSR